MNIKGNGSNHNKIFALIACVLLCITIAISFSFVVNEANHDCAGNDCPACAAIATNTEQLRSIAIAAFLVFLAIRIASSIDNKYLATFLYSIHTPVSLKVKLTN